MKAVIKVKRSTKVLLGVILVIIVAIAALGIWQKNNIIAIIKTLSYTEDEIANEIDAAKKQLEDNLVDQYESVISDFTAEEERKIIKGEISIEDAIKSLDEKYKEKENSVNSSSKNDNQKKVDKLIGDKAIEMYSLKAYYLGQLGQIEASVKKDYLSLPKEKRNLVGKQELVTKYMGTALSLMNQCDSQVNDVLKQLEKGLKDLNADTSVVKTIRNAYENEKALKKAYYLKLLEG